MSKSFLDRTSTAAHGRLYIYMRQKRFLMNGAEYHVTARINRQEYALQPREIKRLMLLVIGKAKKRYRFSVRNFCIMDTHIHLMIQPRGNENLSRIMQWILSVFAKRYNTLRGIRGHLWYDRFRSKVILSMRQRWQTFLYIAENPVKAGKVSQAVDYEFGGVRFMLNGDTALLLKYEPYFALFYHDRSPPRSVSEDST